jgi:hypothetical protein
MFMVTWAQADGPPLRSEAHRMTRSVILIRLGPGEMCKVSADRAIPCEGEQAGIRTAAEAIGALPAHADGLGRSGDAAVASEEFEEG